MKLIGASKVFVCNPSFEILDRYGILFDVSQEQNTILAIDTFDTLRQQYPSAEYEFFEDCVLTPALSNAHIHFEFSANKTSLVYGDFGEWLNSVIDKREMLLSDHTQAIHNAIQEQLKSGIVNVGAISSYGGDIAPLAHSPLRVVLFNEVIGSNVGMLDMLFNHLLNRLQECQTHQSPSFYPALAIHSPYATHKALIQKAIALAKQNKLRVSAHFLESPQEKEWLQHQQGYFSDFFQKYFDVKNPAPTLDATEFLEILAGTQPLLTHCLQTSETDLRRIAQIQGHIISTPRSNRLLNNQYLDLEALSKHDLHPIIATDGLSSNHTLNLFDELRCAMFAYPHIPLQNLAQSLILGVTHYASQALNINNGILEKGKFADLAVFEIQGITNSSQEALHFVLHTNNAKALFINGQRITL
ncbi:hypothetical protein BBW65_06505 [Helicobacter enhydrae]|uniref:Amidohydrolase-related domain-containing protein n=1 Tax=Helicobacter enhydrae TaxID=222136 RepID=A0A1B1U6S7_9HELI|nr:aminofutalosine deaminase family hydrolase [Helicobacter enhydrae]ANV98468.1 hypothetical protein BBW65_06505 [Helicobacter enhydrae]